jgi:hypothetical protein
MKLYGWLGLLLLILSEICLFLGIEPFHTWFYCFAWWSYVLLADNLLLRLRGRSLFAGRRGELSRMLPISVFVWLLFEGYNLALRNWAYVGVPSEMPVRWAGYSIAFATVLPGIFVTSDLVEHFLFGRGARPYASEAEELSSAAPAALPRAPLIAGFCLSVVPLIWPRYFFPLVWLGPLFLLDPLLRRLGIQGLAAGIAAGDRRRIWSLMIGGFACGVLWEFWNYWASSHWVYSVPFFGGAKLFQMPALGFLGFPPFALECWVLYHLLVRWGRRRRPAFARAGFWFGLALYCALMFRLIDRYSVLSFAWNLNWSIPSWRLI